MIGAKEIDEFASIINECRHLVERLKIPVEVNLNYIFSILYGKTLLTMCEIHTLLKAGYPEGAMALARHTFETMVIMEYLNKHQDDGKLLERVCDDFNVRTCYDHIKSLEWVIANGEDSEDTRKRLQELNDEYENLLKKYAKFSSSNKYATYFSQYWWAGKKKNGKDRSFYDFRKATNNQNNFFYDMSCYRVHAGMTGGILTFDNSEEGFLIGACEGGKETPLQFALMNFIMVTALYSNIQTVDFSAIISKIKSLINRIKIHM